MRLRPVLLPSCPLPNVHRPHRPPSRLLLTRARTSVRGRAPASRPPRRRQLPHLPHPLPPPLRAAAPVERQHCVIIVISPVILPGTAPIDEWCHVHCDRRAPKERRLIGRKYKLFIFNVPSHNFATKTRQHLQRVVHSKNKGSVSRILQARHAKDLGGTRIASAQRTSRHGPPRPFKMTC